MVRKFIINSGFKQCTPHSIFKRWFVVFFKLLSLTEGLGTCPMSSGGFASCEIGQRISHTVVFIYIQLFSCKFGSFYIKILVGKIAQDVEMVLPMG